MRSRAFPRVVLLGVLTFAFVPGLAGAASQGRDLTGMLASSAGERATAVSGPVISVSLASHDFGRVNVGSSSGTFDFTISNTGEATLNISAINHIASGFSASAGSLTIPVGGSSLLSTFYTPSGSGPQLDNVTIVSDADNGTFSVLLKGTANTAPVFSPALASDYSAFAFVAFSLTAGASDAEGDGLSWAFASVQPLPVGATFDGTTGALNWTPGPADAGNYAITITVSDGLISTPGLFTLHVTAANHPPVANPGSSYKGLTGIPLAMTGAGSSDPDGGQMLSYAWEFGDGGSGVGVNVSHTYAVAGSYIVGLTVTDNGSPVLSSTATTGAKIVDFVPVTVVLPTGASNVLKKKGNMKFGLECYVRPLTEIDPNSIRLSTTYPNAGDVSEVPVVSRRGYIIGDINANLFFDLDLSFKGSVLRQLVNHVPANTLITLVFNATTLADHVPVRGTIEMIKHGAGNEGRREDTAAVTSAASPNPFKPETIIRYAVPGMGPVSVRVYSVNGALIRTLRQEISNPGAYEVRWNGKDNEDRTAPSGIYFVSVQQGFQFSTTRVVLAR